MTTETADTVEIIMNIKKNEKPETDLEKRDTDQYFGATPILESSPIDIPNARQCRVNHGLVTAIPSGDITLGAWKARVKSFERRKKEIGKLKSDFEK